LNEQSELDPALSAMWKDVAGENENRLLLATLASIGLEEDGEASHYRTTPEIEEQLARLGCPLGDLYSRLVTLQDRSLVVSRNNADGTSEWQVAVPLLARWIRALHDSAELARVVREALDAAAEPDDLEVVN
jgi:hypothetical protein